jgi:hypothetical protein
MESAAGDLQLWEYFVLQEGLVDWADIAFTMSQAEHHGGLVSEADIRRETLAFVRKAVSRGWMRIGDPDPSLGTPGGPEGWAISGDEAASRVAKELDALGRRPYQPEIAWLWTTPEGEKAMAAYDAEHPIE